jgi:hypothetical protein
MILPRDKQETDMTELNNEIRTLNSAELDAVSGAGIAETLAGAVAHGARIERALNEPGPTSKELIKAWTGMQG